MKKDFNIGVILTPQGIEELGEFIKPFMQKGSIGSYIYCKSLEFEHPFARILFTPEQAKISAEVVIRVPSRHVLCTIEAAPNDRKSVGFT